MALRIFPILLCALLAQPAFAQTLYKSTMPDGKVIYGDKPAPGAVKSEEQKPDISKGITPAQKSDAGLPAKADKERANRDRQQARIEAAEKRLREAEAAREAGKEPGAGDRLGTVSGNQRLTDDYWARQKKLENDVESARELLEKARSGTK